MKTYTKQELDLILNNHKLWIKGDSEGIHANLTGAGLRSANLRSADLRSADLRSADLRNADLRSADLRNADLRNADLTGANLAGADLTGADLRNADLAGADLPNFLIVPEIGCFYGFKKVILNDNSKGILTLIVGQNAKRINSLIGRKCRAEYAKVVNITNLDETIKYNIAKSSHKIDFTYIVGQIIKPDSYNDDIRLECTNGIHFFITKKEAKEY